MRGSPRETNADVETHCAIFRDRKLNTIGSSSSACGLVMSILPEVASGTLPAQHHAPPARKIEHAARWHGW